MFNTRMLSGSELVAKGATRKIDGQLPELGFKEVSPSGSWLEQKQIQSALEARKHLIEVERIEKNGSLSHAVWKDDLKLAEVTKKSGSHWQFIGHNVGKHLYLLPEEALFLIEVNCLLLKHNEVTVSLQKAYCLCLDDEISINQYKVYASLSRLGYRVFRHKEPILDNKSNILNTFKENIMTDVTDAPENYPQTSQTVAIIKEQLNSNIANNVNETKGDKTIDCDCVDDNQKKECIDDAKIEICNSVSNRVTDDELLVKSEIHVLCSNESDSLAPLIDAKHIKVENKINNSIEKMLQSSEVDPRKNNKSKGDMTPPTDKPAHNKRLNTNHSNGCISMEDIKSIAENQETEILTQSKMEVGNINESAVTINDSISTATQEIEMATLEENGVHNNANQDNSITNENYEAPAAVLNNNSNEIMGTTIESKKNSDNRIAIINETIKTERLNTIVQDIVYSVDESGIIRVFRKDDPMETDAESNVSNAGTATNPNIAENAAPGSYTNGSGITHYDAEINHYEAKMQRLIERKSNASKKTNLEGSNTMQDFYHEQVVRVNVPDEKYLPRNIFLHKTAYVINVDVVRNQNASNANVSSDEMDLNESPNRASRGTDAPSLTDLPRFVPHMSMNNTHTRYPPYRPFERTPPHWSPRINYNSYYNMLRPPHLQGYFVQPRYRYQPQPFIRHSMSYNLNAPGAFGHNQAHRQNETLKTFHFNAILHIASRFKKGVGRCVQVQALNNLLCTYNARYGEHLELTREFDIVDKEVQPVRDVIVLDDDEPQCKKARLKDDTEKINENIERLKELAGKLKDLHAKNLAVSRHRRVFSNAIKTFNKSFSADLYLDSNFEIKDRKLIVLDSSSDSDVVVSVKEKNKSKKRKRLRNPYSILKIGLNNVNVGASTTREVPILKTLSLNVINDAGTSPNITHENNIDTSSPITENTGEGLLKYFDKAWLPSDEDFGRAALCSREIARLDSHLFEAEYLYDVMKESVAEFESWVDLKLAVLKDILESLDIQKQQAEALSNDFLMETESQMKPILGSSCIDLKTALKQLAIIPTNKEIPTKTSLRIHFDVCNRDVHFKKSNPPKPNFRVICCDESAAFPSSNDVVAVQAKYDDAVPTVFAFVGTSGSISYLQINSIDLPVFIADSDLT